MSEPVCRCGGRTTMTTWTVDMLSGWYRYCFDCKGAWVDPETNLRPMGGFCTNREQLETVWLETGTDRWGNTRRTQYQIVPQEDE